MKLIFMGTPDFSVPALQALIDAGFEISAVYSQPPRRAGRGQLTQMSPVHHLADSHEIPVRTPVNFKNMTDREEFAAFDADLAIVVAYGLILQTEILDAPRLGCVNIHASLLPRWRGAAPIQRAIMTGDHETGVAIMAMEAGLDTGSVFAETCLPITNRQTAGELHDQLAQAGADLLLQTLPGILDQSAIAKPQGGRELTYARKIEKAEAQIDWSLPAEHIDRMIRGLSPSPGAWFQVQKHRVKVLLAEPLPSSEVASAPGEVLDDRITIACGRGTLRLLRLQRAGREAMDAEVFLRGFQIETGVTLE